MSGDLKSQLRLTLSEEFSQVARNDPEKPSISPLTDIFSRHDAVMKCQFDAFAGYVSEAEANGIENYPLYEWTKKTVDDPAKRQNTSSPLRFISVSLSETHTRIYWCHVLPNEMNHWSGFSYSIGYSLFMRKVSCHKVGSEDVK